MDVREKLVELLTEFYGSDPMYYGVDASAIAQHLIANGITVQEWISVDDRLPEENGDYLVAINYFGRSYSVDILYFANDGKENAWYFYDIEYGDVPIDSVAYWMPLPELPKEGCQWQG